MMWVVSIDVSIVADEASICMPSTKVMYGTALSALSVTVMPGSTNVPPIERCTGLSPRRVMVGAVVSGPLDCETVSEPHVRGGGGELTLGLDEEVIKGDVGRLWRGEDDAE